MEVNWQQEIAKLVYIKQTLSALDKNQLYPFHFPKIKASCEKIEECQSEIGFFLSEDHAEFLSFANGWDGFMQTANLFGTEDICGGPRFRAASELLDICEANIFASAATSRDAIFPIAASNLDGDIFVQIKPKFPGQGRVLWLAGYLIDQYVSFSEFFLSMMDYNRLGIERLKGTR